MAWTQGGRPARTLGSQATRAGCRRRTAIESTPSRSSAATSSRSPIVCWAASSDAEDILQEAFLRWDRAQPDQVRSARAFLATVVVRLCMDELRSARARREVYVGPWLPEPLVTTGRSDLTRQRGAA